MPYKLRNTEFEQWVASSDTHSDAPGIEKGPSADAEVGETRATPTKPEGVSE